MASLQDSQTRDSPPGQQSEDNEPPSEDPECPICLQSCVYPVQLPCQHIFCYLCIKGVAYRSKKCALCRAVIPAEYLLHPDLVKAAELEAVFKADSGYTWYYEGQHGWWQYDERTNKELEDRYKTMKCSLETEKNAFEMLIAGFLYVIDFDNMVQYRRNEPGRKRQIKRDEASIPKKGIAGLKIRKLRQNRGGAEGVDVTVKKVQNSNTSTQTAARSTTVTSSASSSITTSQHQAPPTRQGQVQSNSSSRTTHQPSDSNYSRSRHHITGSDESLTRVTRAPVARDPVPSSGLGPRAPAGRDPVPSSGLGTRAPVGRDLVPSSGLGPRAPVGRDPVPTSGLGSQAPAGREPVPSSGLGSSDRTSPIGQNRSTGNQPRRVIMGRRSPRSVPNQSGPTPRDSRLLGQDTENPTTAYTTQPLRLQPSSQTRLHAVQPNPRGREASPVPVRGTPTLSNDSISTRDVLSLDSISLEEDSDDSLPISRAEFVQQDDSDTSP